MLKLLLPYTELTGSLQSTGACPTLCMQHMAGLCVLTLGSCCIEALNILEPAMNLRVSSKPERTARHWPSRQFLSPFNTFHNIHIIFLMYWKMCWVIDLCHVAPGSDPKFDEIWSERSEMVWGIVVRILCEPRFYTMTWQACTTASKSLKSFTRTSEAVVCAERSIPNGGHKIYLTSTNIYKCTIHAINAL